MDLGVGALGDELPGERRIATYRDGELVLTDRRILYKGRGLRRQHLGSMRLAQVTGVGITRHLFFNVWLLSVPIGLFLFGLFLGISFESEEPFAFFAMLSLFSLPTPFLGRTAAISVSTPGHTLYVRLPRARRAEARRFLHQVETVRDQLGETVPVPLETAPTATPFGR